MRPLGPADLVRWMEERGVEARLLPLADPTPTVPAAARALGVPPDRILKSILFLWGPGREPVLVILRGTARVDYRRLARVLGVGRKQVRMATPEEILRITGYPVGGVPPFGHRRTLPTLIDGSALAASPVYAGGGDDHTLLELTPGTLKEATGGRVVDVVRREEETEEDR